MHARPLDDPPSLRLSRRRLLAVGGAGVAALWLAPTGALAEAAALPVALRRSSWATLGGPTLRASRDGRTVELRLTAVGDLPVAETLPALRGHDAAFVLRFAGPPGLPAGIYRLQHAELGAFELAFGPLAEAGRYAAVVDRTVRIAGVDDEGAPAGVSVPSARAEQPVAAASAAGDARATAPSAATARSAATRTRPRLRRLAVRAGAGRRHAVAELAVADLAGTRTVTALLLRRGRLVGRGTVAVRARGPLRLRVAAPRALARGRHELALAFVDGEGRTTRTRRRVWLG